MRRRPRWRWAGGAHQKGGGRGDLGEGVPVYSWESQCMVCYGVKIGLRKIRRDPSLGVSPEGGRVNQPTGPPLAPSS